MISLPAAWSLLRLVTSETGIQTSWMYADFFSLGMWCKISVALSSNLVQLAMFRSTLQLQYLAYCVKGTPTRGS